MVSWNAQKKELWHLSIKDLQDKLHQMENQLMKDEMKSRGFVGDMGIPMNRNRVTNTKESHVDLKGLRHKIACLKTMLTVKLKPKAK